MRKTKLMLPLVCLLLTLSLASVCYAPWATGTFALYFHSEEVPSVSDTWWLKTIPCDGVPPKNLTAEGMETNMTEFGNGTDYISHAFQFTEFPGIGALTPSNWTFHFRCIANVTNVSNITVDWFSLYTNENFYHGESFWMWSSLHEEDPTTDYVQVTWEELDVTVEFNETIPVGPTDWLVIAMSGLFDANPCIITIDVDDPVDCEDLCTKITDIGYIYHPSGSGGWDVTVSTLWFTLLPIMFVVGLAIRFTVFKEKPFTIEEVIMLAVAFLMAAVLVPVCLNTIYAA